MPRYDHDNSDLLEKDELREFLLNTVDDVRQQMRPKKFLTEEGSGTGRRFTPPHFGMFQVKYSNSSQRDEFPRATNLDELGQIILVARQAESPLRALQLSLGHIKLQIEQVWPHKCM